MKKMIVMAAMFMASSMAFAADSPALKDILKAKTYAEAEQLVKANLGQLANDEEKARAYNKLVDLAMQAVSKETTIMTENQVAVQMGTGKTKEYDTLGLANAICQAVEAAIECNKYDQLPNAKGKTAPKFAEKNAPRVWVVRSHLVNIGQEEARKGNNAGVLKYWGTFLDSSVDPFFAAQDHKPEEAYIGQVAYFAGRYAYEAKDTERAVKYLDIAMKDPEQKKEAFNYKLYAMSSGLKTHQDSIQFANQLKELYEQDPANEVLLERLYVVYEGLGDKDAQSKLLDDCLQANPNNFTALANKGVMRYNEENYAEAVTYLRRAVNVKTDNAVVVFYLGTALSMQAQDDKLGAAEKKALYKDAVEVFDTCKSIDPEQEQVKWAYNRQNAYYNYYGPDSPEYKQAEADYKK